MSQEGNIRPAPTRARLDLPPAPGRTAPTPTPATAIATAEARYPCRRYRNPVPGRRDAASASAASAADSAIDVHPHQGRTLARPKKQKAFILAQAKNSSSSPRVVAAVSFSLSLIRLRMLKGSRLPFFLGLPAAASKGGPLTTDCPDTSISLLDNQSIMLHGAQSPSTSAAPVATDGIDKARRLRRKRKAETQDNERLSKRLSLLNIEQSGSKLYVPVEEPSIPTPSIPNVAPSSSSSARERPVPNDAMQLDDSKHKVYIYNIDDELSSDSETDDPGKLVFLPDIEKHLRANRIPPAVLANSEGELAGMQLVLYSDPKSLTVPEDKDSVRKAIIESRHRTREQQRLEREGKTNTPSVDRDSTNDAIAPQTYTDDDPDAMDVD